MRLLPIFKTILVLTGAVVGIASRSEAGIITLPPGLSPGDKYRLVFDTGGVTVPASSSISYYDTFVSNAANAVPGLATLGATWTVIGSTATVSAVTNTGFSPVTVGIYGLDGNIVANGTSGLFSGNLINPINITENGNVQQIGGVWTGSDPFGNVGPHPLTAITSVVIIETAGQQTATTLLGGQNWLTTTNVQCTTGNCPALSLYAISSEITVAAAVPEPGSIGLTALGGALLLFAIRRKQVGPSRHSKEPLTSSTH
jgi:hypothetical protein